MEGDCFLLGTRVVIPPSLREKALQELHEEHQGISKMKALSWSYVWWPTIDRDLELLVKSCEPCIEVKLVPPSVDLHPWVWPSRPWHGCLLRCIWLIIRVIYGILLWLTDYLPVCTVTSCPNSVFIVAHYTQYFISNKSLYCIEMCKTSCP